MKWNFSKERGIWKNDHKHIIVCSCSTYAFSCKYFLPLEYNLEHYIVIINGMGISHLVIYSYLEFRQHTHTHRLQVSILSWEIQKVSWGFDSHIWWIPNFKSVLASSMDIFRVLTQKWWITSSLCGTLKLNWI